jgi:RHS repeat-associated protein
VYLGVPWCLGALVAKNFHVPQSFPFDVSDKPFEIRYNENMDISLSPGSTENNSRQFYNYTDDPGYNAHGPYLSPVTTDKIQAITTNYIDTYYIYSFDGKLLSEYDQSGTCVRDYVYAGNRLIAEYRPQTSKYYYYMSDQINSTRIITDDAGAVVYSEAYGPYGDVQKTWTKAYDPKQKFSGKEREGYSELDYFGARYFDNNSYRFISVDPIINKEEALSNPQLWNLYAYCANNPITHLDPDGRDVVLLNSNTRYYGDGHTAILIGNNINGWTFFSRDGEKGSILGGRDQNRLAKFNKLEDFKKSDLWKEFTNRYHINRSSKEDIKMLMRAKSLFGVEYSPSLKLNNDGSIAELNCADFTEEVIKAGGINVEKFDSSSILNIGKHRTSPNKQFDYVKRNNKGDLL